MLFTLPELDKKATRLAVEAKLEDYRICKYLAFESRTASIVASMDAIGGSNANTVSDQTGNIATYNVDEPERRRNYCNWIERAVERLPPIERFLIEKRYMVEDAGYLTDYKVYDFVFDPPISNHKYMDIRWRAIYKLALIMKIEVEAISKQGRP